MSEEEDAGDGDGIVVKRLPWRSDSKFLICMFISYHVKWIYFCIDLELNDIIKKLDAAADAAAKSVSTFTPDRKQRVESSDPSALSPPADAPDWALKPEYRKGEFKIMLMFITLIIFQSMYQVLKWQIKKMKFQISYRLIGMTQLLRLCY